MVAANRSPEQFDEDDEFPEHPLFPKEDETDDNPDVSFIQIFRFEDGKNRCAPEIFRGSELRSLMFIEERYGGGIYELWARRRGKQNPDEPGVIERKRKYEIGGASKPLGNYVQAPPAPPPGAAPVMGDNLLVALLQMQSTQQAAAAQAQQQASQQFMTMMAQMMASSKSESSQMMQMMISMGQQSNQSMVSMITAMMANKGGGPEEMAKFLQIAKSLNGDSNDKKDSGDLDFGSMLENVADAVAGVSNIMAAKAAASGNGAPVPPQMPFVPTGGNQ